MRMAPYLVHTNCTRVVSNFKDLPELCTLTYHNILQMAKENTQPEAQPNNPLHGVKLVTILEELEEKYGWEKLAMKININCFKNDPSVKSSLKFLRRTPWARDKVEQLYLNSMKKNN